MDQKSKAEAFGALHHTGDILILPNAWDAASAAVMAEAGAKAVATSSAAVAWAHGYPDGDTLPIPKVLATIEAVARVVAVPVTKHEHRMWFSTAPQDRARLSKRNYYRFLDRWRDRWDLCVDPHPPAPHDHGPDHHH